jgi:N-acetylglucosaminyl-diphospho-decaprenol L-rhamnosyltransferase
MTTDRPRVAVIVVTYNSANVLGECLASLPDGAREVDLVDVVVADNASRDDSMRIAKEATYLPIRTVQLGRNAGYAAGVNVGVDALSGREFDAVLVLNPDCRLRPGSLACLAAALRQEPRRGIAVPRLVNPDGSLQPSLRRTPTVLGALAESVLGGGLAGRIGLGELITSSRAHRRPGEAVWATGAAMLITAAALRELGPWDESFLLYSEETEYALRAADRGWRLWYEPAAVIEHIGGDIAVNPTLAAMSVVNKVRLFRTRRGRPAWAAYYAAVTLGLVVRTLAGRDTARASLLALTQPSRRLRALPD